MCSVIILWKLLPHLPGANELNLKPVFLLTFIYVSGIRWHNSEFIFTKLSSPQQAIENTMKIRHGAGILLVLL